MLLRKEFCGLKGVVRPSPFWNVAPGKLVLATDCLRHHIGLFFKDKTILRLYHGA